MTSTDILLQILQIAQAGIIAVILIGFGIFLGSRNRASAGPEVLPYRRTPFILLLAFLIYAVDFYARFEAIPGPFLWLLLPSLPFLIYLIAIPIAYREARLGAFADVILESQDLTARKPSRSELIAWPLAGFLTVLIALCWLELKYPFYFTQDDNLVVNLPEIIYGCRSFFHGVFPTWNPYQYMGSPSFSLGWYAFTYPPTFLSYWFAQHVVGTPYATLEVFAFFHLLLSYPVFYWLVRREGCRPAIAMMAATSCMISGYALIFSRSWFQFSPVILWTALMLACVQSFARGDRGWKWIIAYGAVIGVAFHAGHIQMWIYSVMLADFAILLLLWSGTAPWREASKVISAHFLGLALAAPLLVPMLQTLGHVLRRHPDSRGIAEGLVGLFVPASVHPVPHPSGWQNSLPDPRVLGEMYYSGTLFIVLCAILLISLATSRWTRRTLRSNVWFICALLSLWFALGDRGLLWTATMHLPGFSGFRFPFKFLAYLVVFTSMAGALVLERLMRRLRTGFRTEFVLGAVLIAVLAYHVTLSSGSFYTYGFKPYPQPDPVLAARLIPHDNVSYQKVFPFRGLIPDRFEQNAFASHDPRLLDTYANQFPTLLGAFSIEGYNPLVSESPVIQRVRVRLQEDPQRTLFEYGVGYTLQYNSIEERPPYPVRSFPGAHPVYRTRQLLLQQLPTPRPMAFAAEDPDRALPVDIDASGATIHTAAVPNGGRVVLNLLWHRELRAYANGHRLPVGADAWDRITVQVPAGVNEIRISYHPAWEYGLGLGIISLIAGVFLGRWSLKAPAEVKMTEEELLEFAR